MKLSNILLCSTVIAAAVIIVTSEVKVTKCKFKRTTFEPTRRCTIWYGSKSFVVEISAGRVFTIRSDAFLSEDINFESAVRSIIQCELDDGKSIDRAVYLAKRKMGAY